MQGKNILCLLDFDESDFKLFLNRAADLKKEFKAGKKNNTLSGKTLGLLFDKPSTRTRISFESAMIQLGGVPTFISSADTQISRAEPVADTMRVLNKYIDALAIRTSSQEFIAEFAKYADIPVINALTDLYHPCQILSDIMTVIEKKGSCNGLKIAWVGDGNNVANSWINAAALLDFELYLGCPEQHFPNSEILEKALSVRKKHNKKENIFVTKDPFEAVQHADVIYTDVWVSMGMEGEGEKRKKTFADFQVNSKLVSCAKKDVTVMHCLPAHRGEEISNTVLEGRHSVVWDQAENKMHMHKAVLDILIDR